VNYHENRIGLIDRRATIYARLFGRQFGWQSGQKRQIATAPIRPNLRWEFGPQHVPGERAHGTRALQGLSAGTDSGGSSASGTSSKMMRRLVPDQVTEKIIGSPGGATGNEAAGVRRVLFQHGA